MDRRGRPISYLRLSVGDTCNLACRYCPQPTEPPQAPPLSLREITLLMQGATALGIRKVRLSGGEPLLRPDLTAIIAALRQFDGLCVGLTTNGTLLAGQVEALSGVGLNRVNVSLDSLDPRTYTQIAGQPALPHVLEGLARADAAGWSIKLNMVVLRGLNDAEVRDFAALTLERPWQVRFIECMPFGPARGNDWRCSVDQVWTALRSLGRWERVGRDGVARTYRLAGAAGLVGLIGWGDTARCPTCNRLRVTADGHAFGCLYGDESVDLRPLLGDGAGLAAGLAQAVRDKPGSRPDRPHCPELIRATGG